MMCGINLRTVCYLFVILLLRTEIVSCFNIEHREPIVKKGEIGSYFGFSVAQHIEKEIPHNKVEDSWILVGAPLGKNLQPNTNRSGALFKCPISEADCVQVITDGKRLAGGRYKFADFEYSDNEDLSPREPVHLLPPGHDEIKNDQWLGVSVKSQKPGGKVMVCAHRYIQSPNLQLHHYGLGLCYSLKNDLEVEEDLQPCKGRPVEKLHQQYGFCQVGTSLAILDDGYALMGSPGPFTWRGTIFAREIAGTFIDRDMTMYRGILNDEPEPIEKYSYLGMSVAGGYFFTKILSYASGAPRSKLFGEVYFFNKKTQQEELDIILRIRGEQFASSFGYEILAIDVDNDGYDDLLVSAPFYYEDTIGGAVYIYTNLRKCLTSSTCNHTAILKGKSESRFGFSMTSLGDINKDGFTDVAIGAPYEDNTGAVYIYLGAKEGLNLEPSQIIKYGPRFGLKTIGYSLSGGLDMDLNGYPDLLVGAYESDKVILYKTREIIDIIINIEGEELKNINATKKGCRRDPNNQDHTCFSFNSCFRISNMSSSKPFDVKYEIKEVANNKRPSRIWFRNELHLHKLDSSSSRFVKVDNVNKKYCQSETVYIRENVGDILTAIKFLVNYTLANNEPHTPILNKTSVKEFEATFQKSCGDDDICESNLILNAGTSLNETSDGYIFDLGKNNEFLLDANVTNHGESAYEAKLYVIHPEALSYIALQTDKNKTSNVINCSYKNNTLVICSLGNPFQENKTANLRLRFEVKNTKDQKVDLKVFVNSTSKELSQQTSRSFRVVLQKIAEYAIEGKAITPHLFFAGEVKGASAMRFLEDIGARVYHTYQVVNHGQWIIQDMEIVILWPYQVFSTKPQGGKWLLYLEDEPRIDYDPINFCKVLPPEAVNPLRLNSSGLDSGEPGNFTVPYSFTDVPERTRRKRDVDDVIPAETKPGPDGKQRKVVTMDCNSKTANCARIVCYIKQLSNNDPVKIQIYSRIWNSTLVEDYNSDVDWVSIRSFASIHIKDPTIIHSNTSVGTTGIETIAYPSVVLARSDFNIWIIIGSVLLGLIVLIILVYCLYKVGFFKRNRVKDQTLSGNLQKNDAEQENLLQKAAGKK